MNFLGALTLLSLTVVAGCAADASSSERSPSEPSEPSESAEAPTAIARYVSREGQSAKSLEIEIADSAPDCNATPSVGSEYVDLHVIGESVTPSTYEVTNHASERYDASAYSLHSAGNGAVDSVRSAIGGTIVITSTSSGTIAGSFDVDFGTKVESRSFVAVVCPDRLNQRTP